MMQATPCKKAVCSIGTQRSPIIAPAGVPISTTTLPYRLEQRSAFLHATVVTALSTERTQFEFFPCTATRRSEIGNIESLDNGAAIWPILQGCNASCPCLLSSKSPRRAQLSHKGPCVAVRITCGCWDCLQFTQATQIVRASSKANRHLRQSQPPMYQDSSKPQAPAISSARMGI